jgi:hypothetical protein
MFSKDPWVQCGELRVRWHKLHDAVESSTRLNRFAEFWEYFLHMGAEKRVFSPIHPRRVFTDALLEILQTRRGLGVSDPRDMLFAHRATLSVADGTEKEKGLAKVDYGKSCAEVYGDIAKYVFRMKQAHEIDEDSVWAQSGYEILSYAGDPIEAIGQLDDVPIWAPNWMLKGLPYPHWQLRDVLRPKSKKKCWNAMPSLQRNYSVTEGIPTPCHLWIGSSIFASVGLQIGQLCRTSKIITPAQSMWSMIEHPFYIEYISFDTRMELSLFNHWKDIIG